MKSFQNQKVLLTSITSDSHTWNLIFMQLLLEENGYEVINIGSCTPIEDLIHAAHNHKPDLLVISTVNGHGYKEGIEFINEIKKYDMLNNMRSVIGGKLDTDNGSNVSIKENLLKSGFDRVFNDDNSIAEFLKYINAESLLKNRYIGA